MLNISGLQEGVVLDHIQAGKSLDIYYNLGLDKLDCQVQLLKMPAATKWDARKHQGRRQYRKAGSGCSGLY